MWITSFKDELDKCSYALAKMPKMMAKMKFNHPLNKLWQTKPLEHANLLKDSKKLQEFLRKNMDL